MYGFLQATCCFVQLLPDSVEGQLSKWCCPAGLIAAGALQPVSLEVAQQQGEGLQLECESSNAENTAPGKHSPSPHYSLQLSSSPAAWNVGMYANSLLVRPILLQSRLHAVPLCLAHYRCK